MESTKTVFFWRRKRPINETPSGTHSQKQKAKNNKQQQHNTGTTRRGTWTHRKSPGDENEQINISNAPEWANAKTPQEEMELVKLPAFHDPGGEEIRTSYENINRPGRKPLKSMEISTHIYPDDYDLDNRPEQTFYRTIKWYPRANESEILHHPGEEE